MTTNAEDISVVLSGGSTNLNPNGSLGGEPSLSPVLTGTLNNLFSDITAEQALDGYEDYRCMYVFNDGDTTIYNVKVWISDDPSDGSTMAMGIAGVDEVQRITINGGVVTGSSVTFSYLGTTFDSDFDPDLAAWAAALEESLANLEDDDSQRFFKDVIVLGQTAANNTIIFDIKWQGLDAKRNFAKLEKISNDLTPLGIIECIVTVPQDGNPINTIAPEINVSTTPPGGVTFLVPTSTSPITLPRLDPDEGFPLWVRRTTDAETIAKENDGFSLRLSANSLEPST